MPGLKPEVLRNPPRNPFDAASPTASTLGRDMWVPNDIAAIEAAIAAGSLEETSSFDGKKELPVSATSGNKSIAIDMASMSTEGGSILYGVGEDERERLTVRNPIALMGAADRIAQVVQTSISEVPHIEFHPYPLADDPSTGFLLVLVPPSPRAPHQVTVGDDRRYYGRGARGNRRLTEQEVAQLYARRQQQDVDRLARLDEVVRFAPHTPDPPDLGLVHAFAQPVPPDQELWERAVANVGTDDVLQQRIAEAARSVTTRGGHDPSLTGQVYWRQQGADDWRLCSVPEDPVPPNLVVYTVDTRFNIDGRATMFSGRATQRISENGPDPTGRKRIFEMVIGGNLASFFAVAGVLYEAAGYYGAVDVGVAVTSLDDGISVARYEGQQPVFVFLDHAPRYNSPTFTRHRRLAATSDLAEPQALALSLLGRLFAATTGRVDYTPFPE